MQNSQPLLEPVKREPLHRNTQPQILKQPKKKVKKLKQNPFDDLRIQQDDDAYQPQPVQNQWKIQKPNRNPLTINVVDHSRINKFYSHKSLQLYIKYLFIKNCPNPMWLSIKRQSQVQHIIFIDIEIENNLFHRYFNKAIKIEKDKEVQNQEKQEKQEKQENQEKQGKQQQILPFLRNYNLSQRKAIFKQTNFIRQSRDVWDALFVYDDKAAKQQAQLNNKKQLPTKLTQQILQIYQTYTLNEEKRKYNLYPMKQLPAYKQYYQIKQTKQIQLKNKILIIDCQMVMSGNNFQLARISIMNFQGQLIYDQLIKPQAVITNYNTQFSGITEDMLKNVEKKLIDLHGDLENIINQDTILVGHSLENDLHAMKMRHQKVIDTSILYSRKNGSKMKLKTLAYNILKRTIQAGSHCSQQDCKATLQLMRLKVEASQGTIPQDSKDYHMLTQLQQLNKKVVIIDCDLQFIKHRKDYLGVHFEQVQNPTIDSESYIAKFTKYFDKNVKNPDLFCSRIRKISSTQEWEQYYKSVDNIVQNLYQRAPNNSVFLLNFQVNNFYQIFPQNTDYILERRRPFCLILVKAS